MRRAHRVDRLQSEFSAFEEPYSPSPFRRRDGDEGIARSFNLNHAREDFALRVKSSLATILLLMSRLSPSPCPLPKGEGEEPLVAIHTAASSPDRLWSRACLECNTLSTRLRLTGRQQRQMLAGRSALC